MSTSASTIEALQTSIVSARATLHGAFDDTVTARKNVLDATNLTASNVTQRVATYTSARSTLITRSRALAQLLKDSKVAQTTAST